MDIENLLERIRKAEEVDGKHFTKYIEEVKTLKRNCKSQDLEILLYKLIEATETGDSISHWGVAPWYYEELAKFYRRKKEYKKEVEILRRFADNRHARGAKPAKLLERLSRAKELLSKSENKKNHSV